MSRRSIIQSFIKPLLSSALLTSALLLPASAETRSFEGFSQIPLSSELDHNIGELIAMIESQNQALEKALVYLKTQPMFSTTKLQPEYFPAMALILSSDTLAFAPSGRANQAQYKVKFRYDSTRLPDKADKFFQTYYYGITLAKRTLQNNYKLAADCLSYLNKISQAKDPSYQQLLRDTEGKKLQQFYQIYELMLDANTHYQRESFGKSLKAVEDALKLDPNNADIYLTYGIYLAGDKKYDQAIKALNRAIELAPNEASFYLLRGSTYFTQGILYDKSRQDFNRSLELEPDVGLAYMLRGFTEAHRQNCPAALSDFKKACDLGMSSVCEKTSCSF